MADMDCGECERMRKCGGVIAWVNFPTIAVRLMCDIRNLLRDLDFSGINLDIGDISIPIVTKTVSTDTLSFAGANSKILDVSDAASLGVAISGAIVGIISFYGSSDGVTYDVTPLWAKDINGSAVSTAGDPGQSIAPTGTFFFNTATLKTIKMTVTTPGSGVATLVFTKSTVPLG